MRNISPLLFIAYFILYDQLTKFIAGIRGGFPLAALILTFTLYLLFGLLLASSFPANLRSANRTALIVLIIVLLLPALSHILYAVFATYLHPIPWAIKFLSFLRPYSTFAQIGMGYVLLALPALRRRRGYR